MSTVYLICYRYPNGNEHELLAYRTRHGAQASIDRAKRKIAFASCDHWIEEIDESDAAHIVDE